MPALSIPVEEKAEYECPVDHMQALLDFLPNVKAVITIGWRALEDSLMNLLVRRLRPNVNTLVVSRDHESATVIADHIRDMGLTGKITASDLKGFSDLTRRRMASDFLLDYGEYREEYSE